MHDPAPLPALMQVPIRTLVVNQVLQPGLQEKYLQVRGLVGWGTGEGAKRNGAAHVRCTWSRAMTELLGNCPSPWPCLHSHGPTLKGCCRHHLAVWPGHVAVPFLMCVACMKCCLSRRRCPLRSLLPDESCGTSISAPSAADAAGRPAARAAATKGRLGAWQAAADRGAAVRPGGALLFFCLFSLFCFFCFCFVSGAS